MGRAEEACRSVDGGLDRKMRQLRAVAELGQFALAEPGLSRLMDEAVGRVADALGVELVFVLERQSGGRGLLLRAGVGWPDGLVGSATVDANPGSQAGRALLSGDPVVISDLRQGARLHEPPLLLEQGVVGGIDVAVPGPDGRPCAVLGAHAVRRRDFDADDVDFMRSVANLLAGAIRRGAWEDAHRRSERHLRRVIDAMPALVAYVGRDERFQFVNARYEDWFGLPPSEFTGRLLTDFLPDEERENVRQQRAVALQGRAHVWQGEITLPKLGRRPVEVRYSPDIDDDGQPQGFFVLVVDLTDRQQAEAAIADSERRLSSIAANFPGAIYRRVLHADGTVSHPFISHGLSVLVGADPERPVTLTDVAHHHLAPEDSARWTAALRRSADELSSFDVEGRVPLAGGTNRWIRSSAQPYRRPNGDVVWDGVLVDITAHKETEQRLEAALHAREILLREVYHRVKNNLQIIVSLLNLQTAHIHDAEARRRFVETCNRVQTLGLIHRFLYGAEDLVHIDFGHYVQELVQHLFASYGLDPEQVRVDLTIEPLPLELDRAVPLGLILCELISNSIKHALGEGGEGAIRIELRADAGRARLAYSDSGPGFPADLAPRRGALGMSIVQALVMQIAGTVERRPGGGGRVEIAFPLPEGRPVEPA